MNSLISPDNVWMLWTVILSGVALSIWLEQTYGWASKVSGPVVAMVIAMALSNTGLMPMETAVHDKYDHDGKLVRDHRGEVEKVPGVYEFIESDLVPLALPLLLFRANFFQIIKTTGQAFVAVHFATLGSVLGAFMAAFAVHNSPQALIANNANDMAAIMTASYVGGAVNFYAVADTLGTAREVRSSLLVADSIVMAIFFIMLLMIGGSKWARRLYPHPHTKDSMDSRDLAREHWKAKEISLLDIAKALAIAVAIITIAKLSGGYVKGLISDDYANLRNLIGNKFIHITFWSVLAATIFHKPLAKIQGAQELGSFLLYIFLFEIGLPSNCVEVLTTAPMMFVFCAIIAIMNLVIVMVLGKLFRLNLEEVLLASNATLGGPPSAAAMAVSCGWSRLVLPGLLIGIWGYIIGTPVGLMVHQVLRSWLGK
jgi:uncharacterized membrane protein